MSTDLILLTGATGNIGTLVCQSLIKDGVTIRAAYNNKRSEAKALSLGAAEIVQLDVSDRASLDRAFDGVTKALIVVPMRPDMLEIGCGMVDAAKQAGVEHVVRISGMGSAPDAAILLGRWHGQIDVHLKASGLSYTLIQPNSFMQNFITYGVLKSQHRIYLPLGDSKVSWVDVRDVAAVAAKALMGSEHRGKSYVLTGAEALSTEAIAAIFSPHFGRKVTYVDVPEAAATQALLGSGMDAIMAQALEELHAIFKAGYGAEISPDIENVLGRPPLSFDQFAAAVSD